jgi:NTP pyrophosphatase (non-canonical NTP hydrolase)
MTAASPSDIEEYNGSFKREKGFDPDTCLELETWAQLIAEWREAKGFYQPPDIYTDPDLNLSRLYLVIEEITEAGREVRQNEPNQFKYENELADAFIRLFDIVGTQQIDIEDAIDRVMFRNLGRPYKHGRRN